MRICMPERSLLLAANAAGSVLVHDTLRSSLALPETPLFDEPPRPVRFLVAASFYERVFAGAANRTVVRPRDRAVLLAASDSRLEVRVISAPASTDGPPELTRCRGGLISVDLAAEGLRVAQLELMPGASQGWTLAAALLVSAADESRLRLRFYRLWAGGCEAEGGSGAASLVGEWEIRADVAALPVELALLGRRPKPASPVDGTANLDADESWDEIAASISSAAGYGEADRWSATGSGFVVVRDARSVHAIEAPEAATSRSLDLRESAQRDSASLVYAAGPGTQTTLTAMAAFYEHFARPQRAEPPRPHAAPYCRNGSATHLDGCSSGLCSHAIERETAYCLIASSGGSPSSDGGSSPCAGSPPPAMLWLALGVERAGSFSLELVALPELDGIQSPRVRCGLPSDHPAHNLNWYWARSGVDGTAVCVPRPRASTLLPARASLLAVRFRAASFLDPDAASGLTDAAAHSPCDLLLQVPALRFLHDECASRQDDLRTPLQALDLDSRESVVTGFTQAQRLGLEVAMYHALFISLDPESVPSANISSLRSSVLVYGLQEELYTEGGMIIAKLSELHLPGRVTAMHPSPNGMFAWMAVARRHWEVASYERLLALCAAAPSGADDGAVALAAASDDTLSASCDAIMSGGQLPPTSSLFGWEAGACPAGSFCPSFVTELVYPLVVLAPGIHAEHAYSVGVCPSGYFCTAGQRVRCPPGFQCPRPGMSVPVRCDVASEGGAAAASEGETCFDARWRSGVTSPQPCASGSICSLPGQPGLPVPPGWVQVAPIGSTLPNATSTSHVVPCHAGQWCPLGRSLAVHVTEQAASARLAGLAVASRDSAELLCPRGAYCPTTDVPRPLVCEVNASRSAYCPAGTTADAACPAGFACARPWERVTCASGEYCPVGSFYPSPCPAGNFCTTPAVAIECPAGSVCPISSVEPTSCFLSLGCPAGSAHDNLSLRAPITLLLVVALAFALRSVATSGCARLRRRMSLVGNAPAGTTFQAKQDPVEQIVQSKAVAATDGDYERSVGRILASVDETPIQRRVASSAEAVPLVVTFEGVQMQNPTSGQPIGQPLTGEFLPGLTLILGPSGCGKSSLLTALAGRVRARGMMSVNQTLAPQGLAAHLGSSFGAIAQDESFFPTLTVWENLWFAASTRVPRAEVHGAVQQALEGMGIGHITNSYVGDVVRRGISGGERRRLHAALELVASPRVVFIDELTSGLDATSAKSVMSYVKRYVHDKGATVACVIHQPRVELLELSDQLLVLGCSGHAMYMGPTDGLLPAVQGWGLELPTFTSLSDFILDVCSDQAQEAAIRHKVEGGGGCHINDEAATGGAPPTQPVSSDSGSMRLHAVRRAGLQPCFLLVLDLQARLRLRSPMLINELVLYFFGGAIVGLNFIGQPFVGPLPADIIEQCPAQLRHICEMPVKNMLPPLFAMWALSLALLGTMSGIQCFKETSLAMLDRLRSWQVPMHKYLLATMLVHLATTLAVPAIFAVTVRQLVSVRASFSVVYLLSVYGHFSAAGCGMLVAVVFRDTWAAIGWGIFIIMLNVIFSGSVVPLSVLSQGSYAFLVPLTATTYVRWLCESFVVSELQGWVPLYNISSTLAIAGYSADGGYERGIVGCLLIGISVRLLALAAIWCSFDSASAAAASSALGRRTRAAFDDMRRARPAPFALALADGTSV